MRQRYKYSVQDDRGCVSVTSLVIGYLSNNCYIITDTTDQITHDAVDAVCNECHALLIDPAGDPDAIMEALGDAKLDYIFLTHNHPDHVLALPELVKRTQAQVLISEQDAHLIETGQPEMFRGWGIVKPVHVDRKLKDGDTFTLGTTTFEALLTPGHTLGGMCLYARANDKPGVLFTGDTLFCGTTGRVDFEGGSASDMRRSLRTKLAALPDDTIVYPGHEAFTTIGAERVRTIERF